MEKLRIQGLATTRSHYAFKHTRGGNSITRADSVVGLSSRVRPGRYHSCCKGGCLRQKKRGIIHQLLYSSFLKGILTMSPVEYLAGSQLTSGAWEIVCKSCLRCGAEGKGYWVDGKANRFRIIAYAKRGTPQISARH